MLLKISQEIFNFSKNLLKISKSNIQNILKILTILEHLWTTKILQIFEKSDLPLGTKAHLTRHILNLGDVNLG